jgi:5-formyltetrahydrofolate cyclo-ligase
MDKISLRKMLRAKRRAVTDPELAKQAVKHFVKSDLFKQSESIACYLHQDGEMDAMPLVEAIWAADKECYLPVVNPSHKVLSFSRYAKTDSLRENHLGILEPVYTLNINARELDLVLAPLVGFDPHGRRLGMGGGYYDQTFAFLKEHDKPFFMGVAYECQACDEITKEHQDVDIRAVLTEERLLYF